MSVLSWLRGEERAVDASNFNLALDADFGGGTSGVKVTHENATQLIAAYACVTLIADTISSLPVDLLRKTNGVREEVSRRPGWLSFPNPETTWKQLVSQALHSLLIAGNSYTLIGSRDALAFPAELWQLHPADVTVRRERGQKVYVVGGKTYSQFTANRPDGKVLHIMGHSADGLVGLSPIDEAQQAVGLGMALEQFGARFFGQGSQPAGVVELPSGSSATEEQLKAWGKAWRRKFSGVENAWKTPVLGNGATFKPLTLPNDQAQFLESRKFNVAEIARLYRVPPHLIGDVERSTSWGTGIEEQNIAFVTYSLNSWLSRLEDGFSQLTPRGQYVRWNVNGLLRGDVTSRFGAYSVGIQNGFLSRNEARELEDRPPVDGLDEFLIPVSQAQPQEQPA